MGKNRKSHKKIVKRKRTRTNKTIRGGMFGIFGYGKSEKVRPYTPAPRYQYPIVVFNEKYYKVGTQWGRNHIEIGHLAEPKNEYNIPAEGENNRVEKKARLMMKQIVSETYAFPTSSAERFVLAWEIEYIILICGYIYNRELKKSLEKKPNQLENWKYNILPISKLVSELFLKLLHHSFYQYGDIFDGRRQDIISAIFPEKITTYYDFLMGVNIVKKSKEYKNLTPDQRKGINFVLNAVPADLKAEFKSEVDKPEEAESEAAVSEAAEFEAAEFEAAKSEAAKSEAAEREAAEREAAKREAAEREAAERETVEYKAAEREALKAKYKALEDELMKTILEDNKLYRNTRI